MRITVSQLRRIIKEEVSRATRAHRRLFEGTPVKTPIKKGEQFDATYQSYEGAKKIQGVVRLNQYDQARFYPDAKYNDEFERAGIDYAHEDGIPIHGDPESIITWLPSSPPPPPSWMSPSEPKKSEWEHDRFENWR